MRKNLDCFAVRIIRYLMLISSLVVLVSLVACKDGTSNNNDDTDLPVVLSGDLSGLAQDIKYTADFNGSMYFDNNRTSPVIVSNGHWIIEANHNLYDGQHEVDVELTDGGYDHVNIRAYLTKNALTFASTGKGLKVAEKGKSDALTIEDFAVFVNDNSGISKPAEGIWKGVYIETDRLWKFNFDTKTYELVDEPFSADSQTLGNLTDVFANDMDDYSDGVINGLPIYTSKTWDENTMGEKPHPSNRKEGWFTCFPDKDLVRLNVSLQEGSDINDDGEVFAGILTYNPNIVNLGRGTISIDVAQMINDWTQEAYKLTTDGAGHPGVKAKLAARYMRLLPVNTKVQSDTNGQLVLDGADNTR